MSSIGDNSPLWGSAQFSYSKYGLSTPTHWPGSPQESMQQHQEFTYHSYPGRDDAQFIELKPESGIEIVEADSTISEQALNNNHLSWPAYQQQPFHIPHGGYLPPGLIPQSPFPNSNNVLLLDNGTFMPHNRQSPDGGYSSPGSIGSEYYNGYHVQPHGYNATQQPYQGTPPSTAEPITIKLGDLDIVIKDEATEGYKTEEPTLLQNLTPTSGVEKFDRKKAIIHENILIRPATKPINYENISAQVVKPEQTAHPYTNPNNHLDGAIQFNIQPLPEQLGYENLHQADNKQQSPQTVVQPQQQPQRSQGKKTRKQRHSAPNALLKSAIELDAHKRRSARPSVIANSPYACEDCGNYFARQCGLTQHRKWIHSENRHIPCEKCGKKFLTQEELTKHMVRHEQEDKPHKCVLCTKQFCHKNDLRRHMFRHNNSAPFSCKECAKSFIRKDHLVAHMLSHERRQKRYKNRVGELSN
ncbi:GDNF-inducible zinc finger protein 1-like isoform X2 [Wyeomyia smithii]|nr:GDNF-inducible zinc finger protein 1-like isoform X2 [Wyeomyia smithii]